MLRLQTRHILALALVVAAMLAPRPARAQNTACDLSGMLPETARAFLGTPWVETRQIDVEGHTLQIRFCAPQAQSIVAERMFDLAQRALPVLDGLTDVQLDGSHLRTIYMDTSEHVYSRGADGYINQSDQITLHQASLESTVVHELAHYWSDRQRFGEAWMVEAYAEYLTMLAMAQLGEPYTPHQLVPACEDMPLRRWQIELPGKESCAYSVGPRVFQALAKAAGEDTLRQVIGELSLQQPGGVNSYLLLARLEQKSGADVSLIMRDDVFGPEDYESLTLRSEARARLKGLAPLAAGLGIALPASIAEDLDNWRHAEAAAKLAQLEPLLISADATRLRCEELELACARPWAQLGADPATWPALGTALADAPLLLSKYGELRDAAASLNLSVPAPLQAAAASLSLDGLPQLRAALDALAKVRELEGRCDAELRCRTYWLTAWEAGDVAAVSATAGELTALAGSGARLEAACGAVAPACRRLWREALGAEGVAGARATIEELTALLAEGARVETVCAAAGWPCATGWREALGTNGPAAARRLLAEQEAALPQLAALERGLTPPDEDTPILARVLNAGDGSQTALGEARGAFERGEVATALELASAAWEGRERRLSWAHQATLAGVIAAGALLVVVLAVVVRRRHRARAAARLARAAAPAEQAPAARPSEGDVLAQLLAELPEERGPRSSAS